MLGNLPDVEIFAEVRKSLDPRAGIVLIRGLAYNRRSQEKNSMLEAKTRSSTFSIIRVIQQGRMEFRSDSWQRWERNSSIRRNGYKNGSLSRTRKSPSIVSLSSSQQDSNNPHTWKMVSQCRTPFPSSRKLISNCLDDVVYDHKFATDDVLGLDHVDKSGRSRGLGAEKAIVIKG